MEASAPHRRSWKIRTGPSGVHLFERATGLNVLIDELEAPATSWSIAPRHLSIALTNACDLSCVHCFAPKHKAALDPDLVKRWLVELDLNGCLGVGFGGGEPTLFPALAELCRFGTQQTKLAMTLTTHGHHLTERLIDNLAGNVQFVRLSMDGVGPTYETIRGRSYTDFLARLRSVRRLARFGINFLVNERTLADLDAAVALGADAGANQFLLLPERRTARVTGIDGALMRRLRGWVEEYRGPLSLAITEGFADGFPTCNPVEYENGLRAYAHIDASGTLKETSYAPQGVALVSGSLMDGIQQLRNRSQREQP